MSDYRYHIDLVDTTGEWNSFITRLEADTPQEVGECIQKLEDEDRLDWPNEVQVCKVRDLSGDLDDEEREQLDDLTAALDEQLYEEPP